MTRFKLILWGLLLLTLLGLGHETGREVALGAVAQWSSHNYDALLILPPSYPPRQRLTTFIAGKQRSLPFQVGRVIGATAAILQGVTEIADGTGRVQLGLMVSVENVGMGGVVVVSGVAEGVHGAAVAANGVRGWLESANQLLKMTAKGSGGGKNYTFFTDEEIAKRLGVTKKVYEREIKAQIKSEAVTFMRKIGAKNPDVGIDNDTGYIVLKHPDNGQTIVTDLLFDWFKAGGE